jgi:glycosyltransferase involved in cell wall biosynthesis
VTLGSQPARISIAMPSYNQAAFLEEAITSILEQDYPNLEFIVLDGGSTDGSLTILEKYAARFAYWHSRPDRGQIDALIQGLGMATGDLLGWVNSDDVLLPGALWALAAAHARVPDAGLIGGNYILIDHSGMVTRVKRHPAQARLFARFGLVVVNQPGSLFTRKAFNAVSGFDARFDYVMDTDLYHRILTTGCSYVHVDRWLSAFRIHSRAKTVAQRDRTEIEWRRAKASWFSGTRGYEARLRLTRSAYKLWQLGNGNYARAAFATMRARGSNWRAWALANCPTSLEDRFALPGPSQGTDPPGERSQ